MRMEEIRQKYPDAWLVIEYSQLNQDLEVLEGEVIAHAYSRDEVYKKLADFKGKNVAIEYTGKVPEDLAVLF